VEITYLGNEGFLITAGETRILIDALYGDGLHLLHNPEARFVSTEQAVARLRQELDRYQEVAGRRRRRRNDGARVR